MERIGLIMVHSTNIISVLDLSLAIILLQDRKLGREPTGQPDRYNQTEEGGFARSNHQQTGWR